MLESCLWANNMGSNLHSLIALLRMKCLLIRHLLCLLQAVFWHPVAGLSRTPAEASMIDLK
jgi:hypothetical protein